MAIDLSVNGGSVIYGMSTNGLFTIDRLNKQIGTPIPFVDTSGASYITSINGITIDSNGSMYGMIQSGDFRIVDIDKATATVTDASKQTGFEIRGALTIDTNTNTIYALDSGIGHMLGINPITGAGTLIGAIVPWTNQLVYNPGNAITYGVWGAANSNIIYSIDVTNGTSTYVSGWNSGIPSQNGLAINPTTFELYSSDNITPFPNLVAFDTMGNLSNSNIFNIQDSTRISVVGLEWNSIRLTGK